MKYSYRTQGTCSSVIELEVENNTVHNVRFMGGCHGNLQAVARLVEGLSCEEVITRCGGIRCGMKNTSCPDQLARAVQLVAAEQAK